MYIAVYKGGTSGKEKVGSLNESMIQFTKWIIITRDWEKSILYHFFILFSKGAQEMDSMDKCLVFFRGDVSKIGSQIKSTIH